MWPYMKVVGFGNRSEVLGFVNGALEYREQFGSRHAIAVGVKIGDLACSESEKAGRDRCADNGLTSKQYPALAQLRQLFIEDDRVQNHVHYTGNPHNMADQLSRIMDAAGPFIHAIQLNHDWSAEAELAKFHNKYPMMNVILRVSRDAMRAVGGKPVRVAKRLRGYGQLITGALLNFSGPAEEGGLLFPVEELRDHLLAINERVPALDLAVAGGLGNTRHSIRGVAALTKLLPKDFPVLSFTAGAALLTAANEMFAGSAILFARNLQELLMNV